VQDCKPWSVIQGKQYYALSLRQVRIITRPKPVLSGMEQVIWKTRDTDRTKELAEALSRARVSEGREKDEVYQEFELLALRSKLNTWLKGHEFEDFKLTAPSKETWYKIHR
jgi:hypothetical protein